MSKIKFNYSCPKCQQKQLIDVINSGVLTFNCSQCGRLKIFLTTPIYPLFFDKGLLAFKDKKYSEAFVLLHKSYENFLSTFVKGALTDRTLAVHGAFDHTLANKFYIDKLDTSEKIRHSFETLYFTIFGEIPPRLQKSSIKKRDRFFHADLVINRDDVIHLIENIVLFIGSVEIKVHNIENPIILVGNLSIEWAMNSSAAPYQFRPSSKSIFFNTVMQSINVEDIIKHWDLTN